MCLFFVTSQAYTSFENLSSERVVGVKVGDWFEYKLTSLLNTNNPSRRWPGAWGPQEIVECRIEVEGVLGTNVTFILSARTIDGTWINASQWIDVRTGQSNPPNVFMAIAANLSTVSVYEDPAFENVVINYTTTGYYGENFRDVNVVLLESLTVQHFGGIPYTRFESRWDKITGMKVEHIYRIDDVENETSYYHAEQRIQLTRTNAWSKKEWKVGVDVGDWWKYGNITLKLDISDPNATPSIFQPFFLANETDWQTFNVTEVSGRNVTLKTIVHFKNQTEISETIQFDIANGTSVGFILIVPNLKVGEFISIDGPPILYEKSYSSTGVTRRVCVFNASEQINDGSASGSIIYDLVWDKFSGILLAVDEHVNITNGSAYYRLDFHMNVVETNLWGLHAHIINVNDQQFTVTTFSNASISNMALSIEEKALIFNFKGFEGTIGYCNITVPKTLLSCDSHSGWQLYIDENPITDFLVTDNDTHTSIYFTYTLSSHQVKLVGQQIIPEFLNWHSLTLLIITISVAIALRKIGKPAGKSSRRSIVSSTLIDTPNLNPKFFKDSRQANASGYS
jgi:hypothetical protein